MLFLAALAASVNLVAIDLGSQFIKLARTSSDNEIRILPDLATKSVMRPAAVAVKSPRDFTPPLSESDFFDVEIRTGSPALPLLKRNSSLGFQFLPRAIGRRTTSKFYTSAVANITELLAMLINDAVFPELPIDGMVIAMPSYSSFEQSLVVTEACRLYDLPVVPIVSDVISVFNLYAATNTNRFATRAKHVLFVDIGAMSTKVYSGIFTYDQSNPNNEMAMVNQTSTEWTEKVSGYHLAKALAEDEEISFGKAQKLLVKNRDSDDWDDVFDAQLELLADTIRAALAVSGPVDEVQVIGGGSTFKFVSETIKAVAHQPVRRDLSAKEAVVLGALVTLMTRGGGSPYLPTQIYALPPISLNISCNDRTLPYLVKGRVAHSNVTFRNLPEMCNEYRLVADPRTIPAETTPTYRTYHPRSNFTFVEDGNFTGTFIFAPPDQELRAVEWCRGHECYSAQAVASEDRSARLEPSSAFVEMYENARRAAKLRDEALQRLQKINAAIARFGRKNVESPFEPTDEVKELIKGLNAQNEDDGFASLDATAMAEVKATLDRVAKAVRAV
jgi:hypothetical protein